ncbi:MAG TPA: MMPL family transporter [Myxococcota bacterium]|nr:MMPL family transporter [Myxococcota bacterium]
MMRRLAGPAIHIALMAGLLVYLVRELSVTTDVTRLLSSVQDKAQATILRAVADSELSRTLIVSLAAPTREDAVRASELFEALVGAHPEVAWTQSGVPEGVEAALHALYFPRRFELASADPGSELAPLRTDEGLAARAARLKEQLGQPMAPLIKRLAPADPLLFFASTLERLDAARPLGLTLHEQRFLTADGAHAIVFLGTRHSPLDADAAEPLLAAIDGAELELTRRIGVPIQLEKAGVHPFGVEGRRSIERDIARISTASVLATLLLFIWVLRSARFVLLAIAPLASGVIAGLSVGVFVFGEVHGLTLAFVATLVGICIDYPLHLLTSHVLGGVGQRASQSLAHVWSATWLSALTAVIGFGALAASSLPGLAEVGLVSVVGLISAVLVTRFVLPPLMPPPRSDHRGGQRVVALIERLLALLSERRRLLLVLLLLGALTIIASFPFMRWAPDLSALHTRDPDILAEDTRVRARLATVEPGRLVVALGPTEEDALRINEAVGARLEALRASGVLGHYRSVSAWLWSSELQLRNRAALNEADLCERLPRVFAAQGFNAEVFKPFTEACAEPPRPLRWQDLTGSPLLPMVRPFRIDLELEGVPQVGFLTFLSQVSDPQALAAAMSEVDGASFVDQADFFGRAYVTYRDRTRLALIVGLLAILVVVALRYRDRAAFLGSVLPSLLGCGLTLSLLTLSGVELNLFHLVSMLLVVAVGLDYGIFLTEVRRRGGRTGSTMVAILFAGLTTLLDFGLLALSTNPAMHAIGISITLGITLTVVFAPCVVLLVASPARSGPGVEPP